MSKHISLSGLKTLLEPLIHLIDKKAERPDWNENDSSSPDYIENRPFYESVKQQLVAEFTSNPTDLSGEINSSMANAGLYVGHMYASELSMLPPESELSSPWSIGKFDIILDKQYDVVYKGQTYNLIAKKYVGDDYATYIGDDSIVDLFLSGGQLSEGARFCFLVLDNHDGSQSSFFLTTTSEIADITIWGQVCEICKIDKKYLPDLPEMTGANIGAPGVGELAEVFNDCSSSAATGYGSHAEGGNGVTLTSDELGWDSVKTGARGAYSHAEGHYTVAQGKASHSEGNCTMANGEASHAEGFGTVVDGQNAHAENYLTKATGNSSHAEGGKTQANGSRSHAEGFATMANGENQHVQGKYNIADTTSAHIVGNGSSYANLSNAHTLDWDGNAWFAGGVYVGSTSGINKDEGCKKLATEEFVSATLDELRQEILGGEW